MCECLFGCSKCEYRNNVIYLLYNEEGYGYIGKSTHLHSRIKLHQQGYKTCGSEKFCGVFDYIILEDHIEAEFLSHKEQYWYDLYNEMFEGKMVNRMRPNGSEYEAEEKEEEKIKRFLKGNKLKERLFLQELFADEYQAEQDEKQKQHYEQQKKRTEERIEELKKDPLKYEAFLQQQKQYATKYKLERNGVKTEEELLLKWKEKKEITHTKRKAERNEQKNEKRECVICGGSYAVKNKATHERTEKHKRAIKPLAETTQPSTII